MNTVAMVVSTGIINSQGARIGRADYLKAWATGFDPEQIIYWDLREEHIVLCRDVALVSAVNKFVEVQDNDTVSGMAAYTDIYILENGDWRCLQAQITMVNSAYWPEDNSIICCYHKGILQTPHDGGLS
jgi:hypothetical protein